MWVCNNCSFLGFSLSQVYFSLYVSEIKDVFGTGQVSFSDRISTLFYGYCNDKNALQKSLRNTILQDSYLVTSLPVFSGSGYRKLFFKFRKQSKLACMFGSQCCFRMQTSRKFSLSLLVFWFSNCQTVLQCTKQIWRKTYKVTRLEASKGYWHLCARWVSNDPRLIAVEIFSSVSIL